MREQSLENGINPANRMKILRKEAPAGLHVGDERRAPRDACEVVEREADAGLVRDGRDVQPGIGGAAGGGDGSAGVFQALLCHQLARQRAAVLQ